MASLTVLYTKPVDDPDGFVEEYNADHLAIATRFPKLASHSTTVFSGTPRRTEAPYFLMFHGVWDSMEDMQEAMGDASMREASKHAMGMTQKYGISAEMLIGDEA